jgi:hypothetical protein
MNKEIKDLREVMVVGDEHHMISIHNTERSHTDWG